MPFIPTTCSLLKYKHCVKCGREIPYREKVWLKPKHGYYCKGCYTNLWFIPKKPEITRKRKSFLDRHTRLRRMVTAIKSIVG